MTETEARSSRQPSSLTVGERAVLESERDFLLASIRDLEEQHRSGELAEDRYQSLRGGYTSRAARVLRLLAAAPTEAPAEPAPPRPRPSPSRRRRLAVAFALGAASVLAGVLLARAISDRQAGQTITGNAQDDRDTATILASGVEERPDDPAAHRAYAAYLLDQGELVEALVHLDEAAALDPTDAGSRAYGGWILYLAGITDEALARIDAAIAADPTYPDAHFFRGMILARTGADPVEAVAELRLYLDLAPPEAPMRPEVEALIAELDQPPSSSGPVR
ncbi:MAG: tetratricopeptide repeat protein [Acidimicrobiales bacterium]